ncbi:MAG: zinc ribbon domain-containing protein [Planctomycetota bacterium]|nr:zinc ribbon domain-containing protein [Planctomycetota bacterium]
MPTYEYVCKGCGKRFEKFQAMRAEPLKECIFCGSKSVQRLLGAGAGVIFKGSGFYETDYKKEKRVDANNSRDDSKKEESKGKNSPDRD